MITRMITWYLMIMLNTIVSLFGIYKINLTVNDLKKIDKKLQTNHWMQSLHGILLILVDGEMFRFKSDATIFQGRIVARSVIQIDRSCVEQKGIGCAHVLCVRGIQLNRDVRMIQR